MGRYLVRRLLAAIPVLILASVAVFLLVHLIPGDPALAVAGPGVPGEEVERIRRLMGLDQPLPVQYVRWLGRVVRGDFGTSLVTRRPIAPELAGRFGNTLQLAVAATVVATILGVPLGVVAAVRQNSFLDVLTVSVAVFGISMPVFWIGLMLMLVFSVFLGLLPAMGKAGPASYVLPTITLAANSMALIARMTRSSMLEVLRQDYVRTARAKGLSERSVVYKHALKNAMIPVVTVVGLQFGYLLGGAVLTETVFVWPGLGWYIANAVFHRDFPVVQAGILLVVTSFVLVNLVVDVVYSYLDPRIALR